MQFVLPSQSVALSFRVLLKTPIPEKYQKKYSMAAVTTEASFNLIPTWPGNEARHHSERRFGPILQLHTFQVKGVPESIQMGQVWACRRGRLCFVFLCCFFFLGGGGGGGGGGGYVHLPSLVPRPCGRPGNGANISLAETHMSDVWV